MEDDSNCKDNSNKLVFYKDYLIRARADAMQDKATLTAIFYVKVVLLAAVLAFMKEPFGTIGLVFLPVLLCVLDYYHRMRFEEIFKRWEYLAKVLIDRIRPLLKDEKLTFLETEIFDDKEIFKDREKKVKTAFAIIPVWAAPLAFVKTVDDLEIMESVSYISGGVWLITMFIFLNLIILLSL